MTRFEGRYADGKTAHLDPVTVELVGDLLAIDGADGRLATWRRDEVRIVARGNTVGGVRLANATDPHARVSVEGVGFLAAVTERWPELAPRRRTPHGRAARVVALAGAALAVTVLVFTVVLPYSSETLAGWVPPSWERALGERVERQLEALLGLLDKPPEDCRGEPGLELVRGLTTRLAAAAGLETVPEPRVIDSGMVNAVALPGGRILVFGGLIREAQSPDELAGVIAHEIGHLKHRHVMRRLIGTMGFDLVIGMMTGGRVGGGNLAVVAVQSSNSREVETEADAAALAMLSKAGIDTGGLAKFFERLAKKEDGGGLMGGLLASHPPSGLRARHAELGGAPGAPAFTSEEWQAVRRVCGAEK